MTGRATAADNSSMTSMNRRILVFAATLLAAGVPALAQDAARGASLLAEARAALGGEDKLRAVRALQARGEFKRMAGAQFTIEGELELSLALPDKMRRDEDMSPPGGGPSFVRTEVLNGTETWEENSGGFMMRRGGPGAPGAGQGNGMRGGRGPMDPEQMRQAQLRGRQAELSRYLLALLLTTNDKVAWLATAESPDGTADVLEITPEQGPAVRLFLDTATHMPLMMTWQGFAPMLLAGRRGRGAGDGAPNGAPAELPRPQQTTLRMTLGEYKTVNGIKLPHFITRGAGDQTNEEWTVSSYRINPSFKADTFTRK